MALFGEDGKSVDIKSLPDATASTPAPADAHWYDKFVPSLDAGSKTEAVMRGAINGGTFGLGKYVNAIVSPALPESMSTADPKKGYWDNVKASLDSEVQNNNQAQADHPMLYGTGQLAAQLPANLLTGGASLPARIAIGAGLGGVQGAADSEGDLTKTAISAGVGGAVPAAFGAAGAAGKAVTNAVTKQAATQVADQLSVNGVVTPLAKQVADKGVGVLNQPQWQAVKDFVLKSNPQQSMTKAVYNAGAQVSKAAKDAGAAPAVVGGVLGGPAVGGIAGSAFGTIAGGFAVPAAAGGVKKAMANNLIQKTLSPAAQTGSKTIANAVAAAKSATGPVEGGLNASKFAAISNMLNQTDPSARAAMNDDNPQNDEDPNQ